MPAQQKTVPTLLRFCASCGATVACWAVWLVLGGTLIALIYIATARELPVPDFMLRRAEAELAKAGLTLRFGRARLDPAGIVLLEDVRFRTRSFEEPVLTCRFLYVRRELWSVLAGRPVPDEIRLEGAALQLPAMLSPSGTVEPLMHDVALVLRHEGQRWLVDQFTGRVGRLTVTAQGEVTPPSARVPGVAALTPDEIVGRALQIGRQLAVKLPLLEAFEQPALAIRLDSPPETGNHAHLLLTAAGADRPGGLPLTLGPLAASGTLRLDGAGSRPLRLHVAASRASYQADYRAEAVRAICTIDVQPDKFTARPRDAQIAAGRLTAPDVAVLGPVLHAELDHWPEVRATVAAQLDGEFLAAEVDAKLLEQSARVRAEGRVSPELIGRVLTRITPRAAPYFVFGDPVWFRATAELDPGWKFARLSGRVDARRLDSRSVKITAARGRIDIEGMSFLASDARVELGDQFATGSYWMNFLSSDYRMLLDGRLRPVEITGWFRGDWWLNFWNARFAFPAAPPAANVEVAGRWRDPAQTVYFGRADARDATVWGGEFERVQALIFLRPNFTHGLALAATRAGGAQQLTGTFRRVAGPGMPALGRFEFDFESTAEPAVLNRMLEGKLAAVLDLLKFSTPPRVHAQGTLGAAADCSFTGTATGGLHFHGFPLESARVSGGVTGDDVRLDMIEFSAAGGKGSGKAAVHGPADYRRLGFDLYVNGADLARSIRAFREYQAGPGGGKTAAADSDFMKRAEGGRLDLGLSATGQPGDLASFTGNGNAALTGAELGEIHLFGLLSQVLSGLSLKFSSLKLDAAHTSFRLEQGRLLFPDLKINGPSAVIDARGNFTFATQALDFTARFKPYEDNLNLLTAVVGIVLNPLTSILELKLSGPIANPEWSVVVSGSRSHPEAPATPAAEAPKPAPPKN
ncbi:MAG: AsmA-like C-terminal region-containing protein [Opitutae bacterium]|nr:AsmA-like C-terminal region-containing protein [Opitutae bacterium]